MKILVISQFYTPDITAAAFRISETVSLLQQMGHEVRVITTHPHKGGATKVGQTEDDPDVYRVHITPYSGGGMWKYINHYLSFVRSSIVKGVKLRFGKWRPDIIWASSPPLFIGITGYVLAKIYRTRLVFDIRDIWPDTAVAAGQISGDGRAYRLGRILEKKLYSLSDHLTCVSSPMANYLQTQSTTPASVIYNGAQSRMVQPQTGEERKNRILYIGNYGRLQGLDTLIRAFASAVKEGRFQDWSVDFIGAGVMQDELQALITDLQMDERIKIHPPVTKENAIRELARSRMLFINLIADDVFTLTIPSKVFDYMLVNRPILFGIEGEGKDILDTTGGNLGFKPSDDASLLEALRAASDNIEELERKATNNAEIVRGTYSREHNAKRLAEVFEEVLKTDKATALQPST